MGFDGDDSQDPACWSWPIPPSDAAPPESEWLTWLAKLMSYRWDLFHGGRCAICGETPQRLVKDHDHVDRLIRGYLCGTCNIREGVNNADTFVRYRRRPPSLILGESVLYDDARPCLATLRRPGYERHHAAFGHLIGLP